MKDTLRMQLLPVVLSVVTCLVLVGLLWFEILAINQFSSEPIVVHIGMVDVLIGMSIYLKTSVDFAIVIGRLMDKNPGLKGRVGIEIGTALGNAAGTMAILLLWAFAKNISWLLAIMIVLAALVLLRLAQDSLEDVDRLAGIHRGLHGFAKRFDALLVGVNKVFDPVLSRLVPSRALNIKTATTITALLATAFTIPFILDLDDFAGYVPLFNVVNVFGFAVGVFVGHALLNICIFAAPSTTVRVVKNPLIAFGGSLVFVGLALWGVYDALKLIVHIR